MKILEYFEAQDPGHWLRQIKSCSWGAAKFLAKLLEEGRFHALLGSDGKLFLLTHGEELVSFATLTAQDCVDDKTMTPWIGFVHTAPEYRGSRRAGLVIDHACAQAAKQGAKRIYIATDHMGVYEKYGFAYLENRVDIYGEDSRIYVRALEGEKL